MTCQEIIRAELHELYLLDRLPDAQKSDYEAHLRDCPRCQQRLQHEKELLAGIQNAGRVAMKQEIQKQVLAAKTIRANRWSSVYRIAALVFILVLTPTVFFVYKTQVKQADLTRPQTEAIPPKEAILLPEKSMSSPDMDVVISEEETKERDSQPAGAGSGLRQSRKEKKQDAGHSPEPQKPRQEADKLEKAEDMRLPVQTRMAPNMLKKKPAPGKKLEMTTALSRTAAKRSAREYEQVAELDDSESTGLAKWTFQVGNKQIVVNPVIAEAFKDQADIYPRSFAVELLSLNKHTWTMTWRLPKHMTQFANDALQMNFTGRDSIRVTFPGDNVNYRINLKEKPLRAVRVLK